MLITGQSNRTILQDFYCRSSLVAHATAIRVLADFTKTLCATHFRMITKQLPQCIIILNNHATCDSSCKVKGLLHGDSWVCMASFNHIFYQTYSKLSSLHMCSLRWHHILLTSDVVLANYIVTYTRVVSKFFLFFFFFLCLEFLYWIHFSSHWSIVLEDKACLVHCNRNLSETHHVF